METNDHQEQSDFNIKTYLRALRWSISALKQCAPGTSLALIFCSVLASFIPVLSTIVLGVLAGRFVRGNGSQDKLIMWLTIAVVLFLLRSLLEELGKYFRRCLNDELSLFMQIKLYKHANQLPLAFFEDNRSLNQLFRVRSSGISSVFAPVGSSINVVTSFFQTASLFGLMAWYAPLPGFFLVLSAIPLLIVQWYLVKKEYLLALSTTQRRRWGNYFTSLLTQPKTLIPVRMLSLTELLLNRFAEAFQSINLERKKLYLKRIKLTMITQVMFFLVFFVVLVWMFHRIHRGDLSVSGLVVFGLAAFRAKLSIAQVVGSTSRALNSSYVINFALDFFDIPVSEPAEQYTVVETKPVAGSITVENLSFTYENTEKEVLKNINLEIKAGQKVAIVGTNGAGKSTLVKLLCRLYKLKVGKIYIDDQNISTLSGASMNTLISLVTQNPIRFEGSVKDNIAFGNWERYKDDDAAVYDVLEKTKLLDFVKQLPDGIDTLIGRKFGDHTLSGGQWQKLAIARILTRSTPILILDEPTSNLDALAEQEIFKMLCEQGKKQTMIFVTHRFSTVKMVDRIIVFEDGHLIEDGSHDELMVLNGVYRAMYRAYQGE